MLNPNRPQHRTLAEGLRWFGPSDPVPLAYLHQAGATDVFTSLHDIPYGEPWPRQAIQARKQAITAAGMQWSVVESVPVHEDIKTGQGNLQSLYQHYCETLRNLAAEGIRVVIYNFMPVLDWVRTDMQYPLSNGARTMRFDPVHFAAFELFALCRPEAERDYSSIVVEQASAWWHSMDSPAQDLFVQSIIDVFPGVKWGLSLEDLRKMLAKYQAMDHAQLQENLAKFLEAVVPVAQEVGVRLAIHPDDPPFSVLGLPRIVSTANDVEFVLSCVDSPANGLCFCTGSFSAREDNDLVSMAQHFAPRIHAAHLRSTQLNDDGSFYEAGHLSGSVDMPAVVQALLSEQDCRVTSGHEDWQIPMRPDHGWTMMDDLDKPPGVTPGYPCIGRMRGLAELRGLMLGLRSR